MIRRTWLWGIWLLVCPPMTQAQENPLAPTLEALQKAMVGVESVAVIHVEATGTQEDLSGLEAALLQALSTVPNLGVTLPDDVQSKAGVEFADSPQGIASVAQKMGTKAGLFPRLIRSTEGMEFILLLVDSQGKTLLDQSFPLASIPPGNKAADPSPPLPNPELKPTPPEPPAPPDQSPPPAISPEEDFLQHRLMIAARTRIRPGESLAIRGRHAAVIINEPARVSTDWMLVEGESTPISELRLAKIAGREDLRKRLNGQIGRLRTWRNVGIGLTLGGFIVSGVAAPFFKGQQSNQVTAGSVIVGTGVAAGITGLVLWLMYGPEYAQAKSPYPNHHLLSREEAQSMIDSYNDELRQQLGLQPPAKGPSQEPSKTGPSGVQLFLAPNKGGGVAGLGFSF